MNSKKLLGLVAVSIGFILLVTNAIGYILKWNIGNPALTIFGLIFVIFGLKFVRKV